MPEAQWTTALDWQAYLEECTAGIRDNALARTVREELRAHLEAECRALVAHGVPPEEAARRALADLGDATQVTRAIAERHRGPNWPRAQVLGTAAGAIGGLVYPCWPAVADVCTWTMHRLGLATGGWVLIAALVAAMSVAVFAAAAVALARCGERAGVFPAELWAAVFAVVGFAATVWAAAHLLVMIGVRAYTAVLPFWPTGVLSPAIRAALGQTAALPAVSWGTLGLAAQVTVWYAKGLLLIAVVVYAVRQARRVWSNGARSWAPSQPTRG